MPGYFKKFFSKKQTCDIPDVETLRNDFKSRYHYFKLLLNSNNKSLDIMASIEEVLKGTHPYGMTHVKAWCTIVITNVWQIITNLNELSNDKYKELYDRFDEIKKEITGFLKAGPQMPGGDLVLPFSEVNKDLADLAGSKMANLGEIKNRLKMDVPNGFVITASGYSLFMEQNDLQVEIDRRIQAAEIEHLDQLYNLSAEIQQLILRSPLPAPLEDAIKKHYGILEEEEKSKISVAMRSSALGEDFFDTSFAGQYRTVLNVSAENICHTYKEIIAGKYMLQAMAYRLNRGIRDEDVAMCVGCMSMADALSSGVVYSRNPVDIRDTSVFINSVWGLPKSIVDGTSPADFFIVARDDSMKIVKRNIQKKQHEFTCFPEEGCRLTDLPASKCETASLNDEQVIELASIAVKLEEHYSVPQDIEWAISENGKITLLQSRPLKQAEMGRRQLLEIKIKDEKANDDILLQGGITAGPGVGSGPVFIARKDMDILKFPENAVLAVDQSQPRWASVLNRASAVLAEQGSIAGHLANVAREFGVPAIFGIKQVLETLEDGQVVTVDADGLRVYRGRKTDFLDIDEGPKNLMEGSPVYKALKGAAGFIVPLNLLDPDSRDFRPENCKTLHDITRFCHEKSVSEMFTFGRDHHFPECSSKQLYYKVPMQWWILNLDDGFNGEVKGKYVKIEDIVSIPMLALWEGILAVPWDGPPPIDGKGFMSVMYGATMNRSLITGVKSQYADRNYFMISKNYCSLHSRLGFHFSTIETLVSERSTENYISFQFKGGAADYERRLSRVQFVRDILEIYDFRVNIREDNLIARIEDRDAGYMKKHLKILGYLTIHTRQLDMIMSNSSAVKRYKEKIRDDIDKIIAVK